MKPAITELTPNAGFILLSGVLMSYRFDGASLIVINPATGFSALSLGGTEAQQALAAIHSWR